jgi:predicted DNA-binding protein (MmcQ/YjbR family)
MANDPKKVAAALRAFALKMPGAHEDFPWGERVVKVGPKGKVFVFLGRDSDDEVGMSVKLPASGGAALAEPFAEPTGYGLGKSGWVSLSFTKKDRVPVDLLARWIEESYRAVAPKKLVAQLDGDGDGDAAPGPRSKPSAKRARRK